MPNISRPSNSEDMLGLPVITDFYLVNLAWASWKVSASGCAALMETKLDIADVMILVFCMEYHMGKNFSNGIHFFPCGM